MAKPTQRRRLKATYYDRIELVPEGDWRDIDFVRAKDSPEEPEEMRDLRIAIQDAARVVVSFFKFDREKRDEFLTMLHQTADTGLRGPNFSIASGRSDLASVKQRLVDSAYELRSIALKKYSKVASLVGGPTLLVGILVYVLSGHVAYLPGANDKGIYATETAILLAMMWIPAGAAAGAWIEFAFRVENLTYDQLLYFDTGRWSPGERLAIVVIVAFVFAFLLAAQAVQVGLGSILLNEFVSTKPYCSLALGFISGFAFPYVRDILYRLKPVEKI